jgi:selenocysteine lyase/cysteine desulfurase
LANWTRRDFLTGTGVAAGALALGATGCTSNGRTATDSAGDDDDSGTADFDAKDWGSVRDQFPLDPDLSHYAAWMLAAHPRMVADAIASHRENLDTDTQRALENAGTFEGNARDLAGTYLNADPEEIALTDSTTAGLGLVYGGLRLRAGNEIVTTEHDHYATHEAVRLAAARSGAVVRKIKLYDHPAFATVDSIVSRLLGAVTPNTRVLALTWVHSSTGVKLPMTTIGQAVRDLNNQRAEADRILLCLDGAHGFGVEARTVNQLGCHFLVTGTHKWLFGPRGTGIVWGNANSWARLVPTIPSFAPVAIEAWANGEVAARRWPGQMATPGGYHSFEHRWALSEAFKFHLMIGRDQVQERTKSQAAALREGLAAIDRVNMVSPASPDLSSGMVVVSLDRRDPFELIELLRGRNVVASVGPHTPRWVRFGPSIVTTPAQGDELVEHIEALA